MSFLEGLIKVLGVVFILVAIIGIVSPSHFKDKKTGKVPKRSDFLMGGAVSATIAFIVAVWISPDKASSEVVEEITHRVSLPNPSHETVAAPRVTNHESHTSELQKTLNLSEARQFARNALRIINETEQALNDGIQLGDTAGITKYVLKPLRSELALWPNLGLPPKDQRKHFEHCRQALTLLNGQGGIPLCLKIAQQPIFERYTQ